MQGLLLFLDIPKYYYALYLQYAFIIYYNTLFATALINNSLIN
jgi:hypothetical protein